MVKQTDSYEEDGDSKDFEGPIDGDIFLAYATTEGKHKYP